MHKIERIENVAVVGASPKDNRYSNIAMRMLAEHGHTPIPVAPARSEILGRKAYPTLSSVPDRIDTVTMYIRPSRQAQVLDDVVQIRPSRIIFNPGAENPGEYDRLRMAGIEVLEACTLIMLSTGQF
jgi:predicted CoA-binding protein